MKFLVTLLLQAVFLFAVAQQTEMPNILWISSEDNSPFLGCYGDEFATTPNLDQLASEGVLYENAFATAPVCAPTRFTLITGVYPPSVGTQNMRSRNPIPEFIRFFPEYLKEKGYYCTNNSKKDYNTIDQPDCWDESSREATWRNRKEGQPFFHVRNLTVSHESSIHKTAETLFHDPEKVPIPPYHPRTPEMKHDWAQYYDKVMEMDRQVGEVLKQLEEDGLAENTIVFYFSDHGGILGRSKRFLHESGTRVPFIVRFPKKYQNLAPAKVGSKLDRLVNFIDFAPTVLSLLDIPIPGYMQGRAFMGEQAQAPRKYAYNFRDRMDEKMDMGRAVRDKEFRYIRNFVPYRPHLQYLGYLWRAPSMASWAAACESGDCNELQQRYFLPKPTEELYDVKNDPHNINNLADDPRYADKLQELRTACLNWMLQIHDAALLPEGEMRMQASEKGISIYELVRQEDFPLSKLLQAADIATQRNNNASNLPEIISMLNDAYPAVRYWAASGLLTNINAAKIDKSYILPLLEDESTDVQIVAAELLYHHYGEQETAMKILKRALVHEEIMVRVRALNVLEYIGKGAEVLKEELQVLTEKEAPNHANYDIRAAENVLLKIKAQK